MDYHNLRIERINKIHDELVKRAKADSNGVFWGNISLVDERFRFENASFDIQRGTAGILLFFLEYYELFRCEQDLEIVEKSALWLSTKLDENHESFSFYSGKMGIVFALLQYEKVIGKNHFSQKISNVSASSHLEDFIHANRENSSFSEGLSGILIVLLHLYSYSLDKSLLKNIEISLSYLVENFKLSYLGLFWDRRESNANPEAGFLRGNCGIAFTLAQYASYFGNTSLLKLCKEAIEFESNLLERTYESHPSAKRKFLSCNYFKNNSMSDKILSWENSYISLEYVKHFFNNLCEESRFNVDNGNALKIELDPNWTNKLSKNLANISSLVFSLYFNKNKECDERISPTSPKIHLLKKKGWALRKSSHYENEKRLYRSGLLSGSTGLAYFDLKLYKNDRETVICPRIFSTEKNDCQINKQFDCEYFETIYSKKIQNCFPETIGLYNRTVKSNIKLLAMDWSNLINKLETLVKTQDNKLLTDVFDFEKEIFSMNSELAVQGMNQKYINSESDIGRIISFIFETDIHSIKLNLSPKIRLVTSQWDFPLTLDGNVDIPRRKLGINTYVLYESTDCVKFLKVDKLDIDIMSIFKKSTNIRLAVKKILKKNKSGFSRFPNEILVNKIKNFAIKNILLLEK